jgi:hypothetical protein
LIGTKRMAGGRIVGDVSALPAAHPVRADELGRDRPRRVTGVEKPARPVVRARTGFHRDGAGRHRRQHLEQLLAPHGTGQPRPPGPIVAVHGEHVLAKSTPILTMAMDFPSQFRLMTQDLNRGTRMPCDSLAASGRGSPFHSSGSSKRHRALRVDLLGAGFPEQRSCWASAARRCGRR